MLVTFSFLFFSLLNAHIAEISRHLPFKKINLSCQVVPCELGGVQGRGHTKHVTGDTFFQCGLRTVKGLMWFM